MILPETFVTASADHGSSQAWWKQLNGYHWFVFIMASCAWMFDCLDQQLFILARNGALSSLMEGADPAAVNKNAGYATSIFIAGWAIGGLIFGAVGDRIGRAKTLAITVLLYSLSTGLSAFANTVTEFFAYRLLTGLGVGGVFGLAVALIADTLPDGVRAKALGWFQALSAVGNVTAGLCYLSLSNMDPKVTWKYLFLIGAAPAFLCIFIMLRMREPEKWVKAKQASKAEGGKAMGDYGSLLLDPKWSKSAYLGMLLCVSGVVGIWGIGFFSPELVKPALKAAFVAEGLEGAALATATAQWTAYALIIQNIGAFLGMLSFAKLAQTIGRKPAFLIGNLGAIAATVFFFTFFNDRSDIWMNGVMGFAQLALMAGYAIYLPELFPTRLRSTGTSFCYNVGRFLAATGPFTLGILQEKLGNMAIARLADGADEATKLTAKLDAFRSAACWMSLIYLMGLIVLPFLPETKDRPLPED
jgi:MFS family permease